MRSSTILTLGLLSLVQAAPSKRQNLSPLMSQGFPDPTIVQDNDGTWYAFATNGNGKKVQAAKASAPEGPWTYLDDTDLLPTVGAWATGVDTWAPDVRRLDNNQYVLYYSSRVVNNEKYHCVGTATSDGNILGPYTPQDTPIACPIDGGGAIDASGFYDDDTARRWLVYKVDGNNIGHGGACGNTVEPLVPTPIMLQEVENDGISPKGDPIQILDRTDSDGPYVEAPDIVKKADGTYILFFSSNCYTTPDYNVNYATATNIEGPYTRAAAPLLRSGDYGLDTPGGATSTRDTGKMVFHANCDAGRCMYEMSYNI